MDHSHHTQDVERQNHRSKWVLVGFLAVAAFFLWTEHRAHLLGMLPFLLVLTCPLMHLFHHGGHGHRDGNSNGSGNVEDARGQVGEKQ